MRGPHSLTDIGLPQLPKFESIILMILYIVVNKQFCLLTVKYTDIVQIRLIINGWAKARILLTDCDSCVSL